MQFITLFTAAAAVFATAGLAAPADQNQGSQPSQPDQSGTPGNWSDNGDWGNGGQWGQKVRVGSTYDLNYGTPLGSLACANFFNQNYPRESSSSAQWLWGARC